MSLRVDSTSLIAGALVCGNRGLGVMGSQIPATGEHGASYLFNDLSLPADADKEIRGLIVTPPAAGDFYAWEDGSIEFAAPVGSYAFTYRLYVDGIDLGLSSGTLIVGAVDVTIAAQVGNAVAYGAMATISAAGDTPIVIQAQVGNAVAAGAGASITAAGGTPIVIQAQVGNAVAAGVRGQIVGNQSADVWILHEVDATGDASPCWRYVANLFPPVTPDAVVPLAVNFAGFLGGESITAVIDATLSVKRGVDPDPMSRLSSAALIAEDGQRIVQWISHPLDRTTYQLHVAILASDGREWSCTAMIPVRQL